MGHYAMINSIRIGSFCKYWCCFSYPFWNGLIKVHTYVHSTLFISVTMFTRAYISTASFLHNQAIKYASF